jgi:hypothetical protein
MNILGALAAGPKSFRGHGVNEENEAFAGELNVAVLEDGRAVMLGYTATLATGKIVHTESTLLAIGPNRKLCLWPVMSELPVVLPHEEIAAMAEPPFTVTAVFASGPRGDTSAFREEITVQLNQDGSLIYAHAWGLPGGAFRDRSSCSMVPTEP